MKNKIIQFIIFCCIFPTLLAQNKIRQLEYWLDTDYASKQTVNVTPTSSLDMNSSIQVNGLKTGLHALHYRFLDSNNKYSTIGTQYIEAFAANQQINQYEYWFDGNYNNKSTLSIPVSSTVSLNNLDISQIQEGMHLLYIRFSDVSGKWSTTQFGRLFKSSGLNVSVNSIAGYRYWIDNAFANAVFKSTTATTPLLNLTETIDLTGFPKGGNHVLNMQFKDNVGLWSTVQSTSLLNTGGGTLIFNVVSGYRYWIDNDFANSVYKDINPTLLSVSIDENIDLKKYMGNGRMLNTQFKDAMGLWSTVITDTVNISSNVGLVDPLYDRGDIHLYPNPNKGEFIISADREIKDAALSVTNTLGEIIYREEFNIVTNYRIRLNNVEPGICFVQIVDRASGKTLKSTKVIIQK